MAADLSNVQYLRYELTAIAYHLKEPGFSSLVRASSRPSVPCCRTLSKVARHKSIPFNRRPAMRDLDEHTIREELEGNLCRCTGYHNIVKSIAAGAKAMAQSA